MRGTGQRPGSAKLVARFSPACAGNGRKARSNARTRPGSAPRVRGTARCAARRPTCGRFSPACAGNGSNRARVAPETSVQPRVCGERALTLMSPPSGCGSAPRVRGTEKQSPDTKGKARFSPACAGNGFHTEQTAGALSVQPRVCGERSTHPARVTVSSGSAPRVRGTGYRNRNRRTWRCFSPACAGNGPTPPSSPPPRPLQPRVCGERAVRHNLHDAEVGSAPRVRGTA